MLVINSVGDGPKNIKYGAFDNHSVEQMTIVQFPDQHWYM